MIKLILLKAEFFLRIPLVECGVHTHTHNCYPGKYLYCKYAIKKAHLYKSDEIYSAGVLIYFKLQGPLILSQNSYSNGLKNLLTRFRIYCRIESKIVLTIVNQRQSSPSINYVITHVKLFATRFFCVFRTVGAIENCL